MTPPDLLLIVLTALGRLLLLLGLEAVVLELVERRQVRRQHGVDVGHPPEPWLP